MSIELSHLDHLVMTTNNIEKTIAFYTQILNMKLIIFNGSRKALVFGTQKINLHEKTSHFTPKAATPTVGALDLCFLVNTPLDTVIQHLKLYNIKIETGPVERTGAQGPIRSIYIRDPDYNLIELANLINTMDTSVINNEGV